jgi:Zn-finger nucleic acid-binding protein
MDCPNCDNKMVELLDVDFDESVDYCPYCQQGGE